MSFESFNLHPKIESGIKDMGYAQPTSIQMESIPPILKGRDALGLAQTGTGKTAAFVIPILQRLITAPQKPVRALIMAPTRELAEQIHQSADRLGRHTRLKSVAIYGGVSKNCQITDLRKGVEIVVACPGRLIDLMDEGKINLSHVEVLVLDEADRMFDMGFLPDIRKIIKRVPARRQTLLFSATMPADIRRLAREILKDPVTVQIGETAPVSTVSHAVYPVAQHLKSALLVKLLQRTVIESVLIFTRTKHRATRLAKRIKQAGLPATSLQGDLSQPQRQKALGGFRDGRYRILVATDIAARGIDVARISHVINYDMPDTVDAYTHRIGRTGRAASTGDAFTFATPQDSPLMWDIENVLGEKMQRRALSGFDYSAPAPEYTGKAGKPHSSGGRGAVPGFIKKMG
jgi:ATP-dependent RNA helicase RhlE